MKLAVKGTSRMFDAPPLWKSIALYHFYESFRQEELLTNFSRLPRLAWWKMSLIQSGVCPSRCWCTGEGWFWLVALVTTVKTLKFCCMALRFNFGLTWIAVEEGGGVFLGDEETKRGLAPKWLLFRGLLNGTETLGFLGGTPGWLITLTGEGSVNLEASVLSVANSLIVSMMESVLTPLFCCCSLLLAALLLLGIITSAIFI